MKRKIGIFCMVFGTVLILAALSLFAWNQMENERAGKTSEEILPRLVEQIKAVSDSVPDPYSWEMTEVEIDGYLYVGYLSIPAIDLELPVMSSWSYEQLKIAPCRYYGSTKTDDLVVCAHNYARHFGNIRKLSIGDAVYFTDMDGVVSAYEVVSLETLVPAAVEEMTSGDFDLTLFTCTYGGATRVTVRCDRAADAETAFSP